MVQSLAIKPDTEICTQADLPSLTPMQHAFVDAWYRSVIGELENSSGERTTTLVGIREAAGYACEKMSRAHQYVDAWRLKNNPKIARWIAYLLEEHRTCTLDTHLVRLNRLGIKAEAKEDYNTARLCETSRAEAVGIKAATRHEVTHFDARTKDEVKDYINEMFGQVIDITPETSADTEPALDSHEDPG